MYIIPKRGLRILHEIILSIKNVSKSFGSTPILKNIYIDIVKGEFLTLLGPSGCGKTTTLRAIAGLEDINAGEIILNGENVSGYPPNKRNVNTVFQNYALFPHMNVYDNIAYGPRIKKQGNETGSEAKIKIKNKIQDMLELVQMTGYEKRMPDELSGGQRQRIAIARALINNPDILLLDEPLGALDLKLRRHMQTELKRIQKTTGITFIYVTHDQEEALNMSDRLAVMNNGVFQQIGTPRQVYDNPETAFVAGFVGDRNCLPAKCLEIKENKALLEISGSRLYGKIMDSSIKEGDQVFVYIHTDRISLTPEKTENSLPVTVRDTGYSGSQTNTVAAVNDNLTLKIIQYNVQSHFSQNQKVFAGWEWEFGVVLREGKADEN